VTALGTTAAKYGGARLGLHTGKEPVGLRAVAAVGLKGTLRHWTRLLLKFFAVCNSLSVYLKAFSNPKGEQRKGVSRAAERDRIEPPIRPFQADRTAVSIGLHKEWCNKKNLSQSLEIDLVFRATIKPAYQRRFPIQRIALWFTLSFLFALASIKTGAKTSSKQCSSLPASGAVRDFCCFCTH
jgi:hypothetical protein